MALAATTLAGAKALNDKTIRVTTGTGFANKMLALVDGEFMRVTSVDLQPTIGVVPGYSGTTAGPHAVLAPVIYGFPADFPSVSGPESASIGADDAAYRPAAVDQIVYLTKGSALAVTLLNPAYLSQQNTITFVQASAFAHVLTYTQGFYGNTTSSDTATFPAGGGGVLTLRANNGAWVPVATASLGVIIG